MAYMNLTLHERQRRSQHREEEREAAKWRLAAFKAPKAHIFQILGLRSQTDFGGTAALPGEQVCRPGLQNKVEPYCNQYMHVPGVTRGLH